MQTFELTNGDKIPVIGYGTWKLDDGEEAYAAVQAAINAGYRLIDTAKQYGNEESVGRAIRESDVEREHIFVTTKLWNEDVGRDSAREACEASLDRLGLDYIDLYLIHWPTNPKRLEAWETMVKLREEGIIKHIGVSNFTTAHLEEMLENSPAPPEVNQIEFHPFVYEEQKEIVTFCQENSILVESYSPLVQASALSHPAVEKIAENHNKSSAQVLIRWALQHVTVPLPKSSNADRIQENIDVFDFELSAEEMEELNNLSDGTRVTSDPHDIP